MFPQAALDTAIKRLEDAKQADPNFSTNNELNEETGTEPRFRSRAEL